MRAVAKILLLAPLFLDSIADGRMVVPGGGLDKPGERPGARAITFDAPDPRFAAQRRVSMTEDGVRARGN